MSHFKSVIHDSHFDSRIEEAVIWVADMTNGAPTPFDLIIDLRVHLKQLNPPRGKNEFKVKDGDNVAKTCKRWNDADWADFTSKYYEQVQGFWDSLFLLTPPATYQGLVYPPTGPQKKRRQVRCLFNLIMNLKHHNAHVTIPVVSLANPGDTFRSHSLLYSNKDVDPDHYREGKLTWEFFTTKHEVGHLLGLGHSNENSKQCREHPDAQICYGATLPQKLDVMGEGSMASLTDAEPWRRRVARHTFTKAKDWKVDWFSADAAFKGSDTLQFDPF